MTADTESMWRTLGGLALHAKNLPVAERYLSLCFTTVQSLLVLMLRCFAALGDVAKAHYIRETHELAKQKQSETVSAYNIGPLNITSNNAIYRGYQELIIFRLKYD